MPHYTEISVRTKQRSHWVDITKNVQRCITESKIQQGICMVSSLHTTAGITINENADPDVGHDFFYKLNQLLPQQDSAFQHVEGNSDSHIKASLVGLSVQVPVVDGRLVLGTWQSVYFCEFDGPRSRRASVTILSNG
jgi:secondary thiamine-phosphate synthase enzyme